VIPSVTIGQSGTQWATVQSLATLSGLGVVSQSQGAGAVYLGPNVNAPNSLQFNTNPGAFVDGGIFAFGGGNTGIIGAPNTGIPGNPPFAGGPDIINPNMQTFAVCVNTDPVGNVNNQTFKTTITISGAGVGPIVIPVWMVIGSPTVPPPTPKFSQLGVFRGQQGLFIVDEDANDVFDLPGDRVVNFGQPGDIPVAGDWDGSGIVRIGVYRPANGHWYLDMNGNGKWDGAAVGLDADIQFGAPTQTCVPTTAAGLAACQDIPVVGDWSGTGVSRLGIFRGGGSPTNGQFYLDSTTAAPGISVHNTFVTDNFGQIGDIPVAANWNGNGTADQIGVYRKGTWIVNATGDGAFHPSDPVYTFGGAGDIPVTGNWNGASTQASDPAKKKIGVFSVFGTWFVDLNGNHVFDGTPPDAIYSFGEPGDLPVVGTWTLP